MAFKSTTQPLCRYCGIAIRKLTSVHWFGENVDFYKNHADRAIHHGEQPRSREAQRCIIEAIVSHQWSTLTKDGDLLPRTEQFVRKVHVWDGESYEDGFFCNGDHARRFAYLLAREGRCTRDNTEALAGQRATMVDAA
jgi:hypothetical protein